MTPIATPGALQRQERHGLGSQPARRCGYAGEAAQGTRLRAPPASRTSTGTSQNGLCGVEPPEDVGSGCRQRLSDVVSAHQLLPNVRSRHGQNRHTSGLACLNACGRVLNNETVVGCCS